MWWTRLISALFVASLAFGMVGCEKKTETKPDAPADTTTEDGATTTDESGG